MQEETSTFQLHTSLSCLEEHLQTGTILLEKKTKKQILQEVVSLKYYEFANVFFERDTKKISSHYLYNYTINLKEEASLLFSKVYNMLEIKLHALKDYLNRMLGKSFICPLASTTKAPVLFVKKKDSLL